MKIPWRKNDSVKRETSLGADVEVLFMATESLQDRLLSLEKNLRDLGNDVRVLNLKVKS